VRPGIRDAVVSVGILFFLVKCAAAAPAPALISDTLKEDFDLKLYTDVNL